MLGSFINGIAGAYTDLQLGKKRKSTTKRHTADTLHFYLESLVRRASDIKAQVKQDLIYALDDISLNDLQGAFDRIEKVKTDYPVISDATRKSLQQIQDKIQDNRYISYRRKHRLHPMLSNGSIMLQFLFTDATRWLSQLGVLREFNEYLTNELPEGIKLMLYKRTEDRQVILQALEKYMKQFFKKSIITYPANQLSYEKMSAKLDDLEAKYPLAKKIYQKETFITNELKDFETNYNRYTYAHFLKVMYEKHIAHPLNLDETIAVYLFFIDYIRKGGSRLYFSQFSLKLMEKVEKKMQGEHLHKELQKRALEVQQKKKQTESNKQFVSPVVMKKEVPEKVVYFAEEVANLAPESINDSVKKYIIRLYRNSKPLNTAYLIKMFGVDDAYMHYIGDIAEKVGIDVVRDNNPTTATGVDYSADDSTLQEVLAIDSKDESYNTVSDIVMPQNAQEFLQLIVASGLQVMNEKQLMKQIQETLIDNDKDGYMKKRLIYGLQNNSHAIWRQKKGKYKALNLSKVYRLLTQNNNGKDYIIGILHHDDYDYFISDMIAGK